MRETPPEKSVAGWNEEIQRQKKVLQYPKWPNEAMLKTLFGGGNYLKRPFKPQPTWRVLDVGCGFANNLIPFADIGCEIHGVDLHEKMASTVTQIMKTRGYNVQLEVGNNRALPYPDAHFDLLLSINTLHYESSGENFEKALQEFRRVLKPGGGCYISTAGPDHEICKRANPIGDSRFQIQDFDFRNGEIFYFVNSEKMLQDLCLRVFNDVETGRVTEQLMKMPLDFFIALCR